MWPALREGTISIWDFSDYSGGGGVNGSGMQAKIRPIYKIKSIYS